MGVIDELLLMVTDGNHSIVERVQNFLRVGVLQTLSLEKLYTQEAKDEDKEAVTINMKEFGKVNWLILFTTRSGLKKL